MLGLNDECRWKTLLINGNVDFTSRLLDLDCGILREGSTSPAVFSISIRALS